MSATATTLAGRAAAEVLMVDGCTITRPSGPAVLDDVTLEYVTPTPTLLYAGKARFKSVSETAYGGTLQAGERQVFEQGVTVSVPITVTGLHVGDVVTCTACLLDQDMPGRVFTVRAIEHKSFLTARRLSCQEVTG